MSLQWIFPPNNRDGIFCPVSFGPVHFQDVIQLEWISTVDAVQVPKDIVMACELSDSCKRKFSRLVFILNF